MVVKRHAEACASAQRLIFLAPLSVLVVESAMIHDKHFTMWHTAQLHINLYPKHIAPLEIQDGCLRHKLSNNVTNNVVTGFIDPNKMGIDTKRKTACAC